MDNNKTSYFPKNKHRKFDLPNLKTPPYISPTPNEIPIIANTPVPKGCKIEDMDFQILHNWGANAAIAGPVIPGGEERVNKLLECAADSGVKIILTGTGYPYSEFYEIARKVNANTEVGAYLIKDEPSFNEWEDYIDKDTESPVIPPTNLYELYYAMRDSFPQHMSFFNLVSDPSQNAHLGSFVNNLKDYLECFQEVFDPPVWMFDDYLAKIYLSPNTPPNVITYRYSYYYHSLLNIKAISKQTCRPFWAYCQCISEKVENKYILPTPTEDLVRFEAFTALALGAKGIAYYRYAEWNNNDPNYTCYTCPVMSDKVRPGVKMTTTTWYVVQKINLEIKQFSSVFLYTEVVDVFSSWVKVKESEDTTSNLKDIYYDEVPLIKLPFGPLESISTDLNTDRRGVVVSHLRFGFQNFLVFVSRSAQDSQIITTKLKHKNRIMFVGMGGVTEGELALSPGAAMDGEYEWNLRPGGYFIIEWHENIHIKPLV